MIKLNAEYHTTITDNEQFKKMIIILGHFDRWYRFSGIYVATVEYTVQFVYDVQMNDDYHKINEHDHHISYDVKFVKMSLYENLNVFFSIWIHRSRFGFIRQPTVAEGCFETSLL